MVVLGEPLRVGASDFVLPVGTVTLLRRVVAALGSRASDAVACALEVQATTPLPVRIGLHTGEVQLRDEGNYMGTTINRCTRIRDLAYAGQTLLSHATHDLVADADVEMCDLGLHRLRDLARPEHLFQLGGGCRFSPACACRNASSGSSSGTV